MFQYRIALFSGAAALAGNLSARFLVDSLLIGAVRRILGVTGVRDPLHGR